MKLRYNAEATELIKLLKDFNLEEFEKWIENLVLLIGSNNVLQYIEEKERWNTTSIQKYDKLLKTDFSKQAQNVIKMIPDFDKQDCIVWFNNAIQIGKPDILNFIEMPKVN